MRRFRYPTWYYGKFIEKDKNQTWVDETGKPFPESQIDLGTLEKYDDQRHGWQNSEEYKRTMREALRDDTP